MRYRTGISGIHLWFVAVIAAGFVAFSSAASQEVPPAVQLPGNEGPVVGPADLKSSKRLTDEQILDLMNPFLRYNPEDEKLVRGWVKRYQDSQEAIDLAKTVIEFVSAAVEVLGGKFVEVTEKFAILNPALLGKTLYENERTLRELLIDGKERVIKLNENLKNSKLNREFAEWALPIWDWPNDPARMNMLRRQKGPVRILDRGSLMEINPQDGKITRVYSEFSASPSGRQADDRPGRDPKELSAFLDRSFKARIGFDDGAKKTELLAAWESVAKAELERRKLAEKMQAAKIDELSARLRQTASELQAAQDRILDALIKAKKTLEQMKDRNEHERKLNEEHKRLQKKKQELDREAARLRGSSDRNAVAAYNRDKHEQDVRVNQYFKNADRLEAEKSALNKAFDGFHKQFEQAQMDRESLQPRQRQLQTDLDVARPAQEQFRREVTQQQNVVDTVAAERGKLAP